MLHRNYGLGSVNAVKVPAPAHSAAPRALAQPKMVGSSRYCRPLMVFTRVSTVLQSQVHCFPEGRRAWQPAACGARAHHGPCRQGTPSCPSLASHGPCKFA